MCMMGNRVWKFTDGIINHSFYSWEETCEEESRNNGTDIEQRLYETEKTQTEVTVAGKQKH